MLKPEQKHAIDSGLAYCTSIGCWLSTVIIEAEDTVKALTVGVAFCIACVRLAIDIRQFWRGRKKK